MYNIELLPAAHGDAIWIEYGDPDDPVRIVIDGGPAPTYARGLMSRLEVLRSGNGKRRIDLFVISHIDCDHIDGAIIFLQECKERKIEVREIWFNGFSQLGPRQLDTFQPLQGEFLGALLKVDEDFKKSWNTTFRNQAPMNPPASPAVSAPDAVVVPDEGPLPSFPLPQNGKLTLLSPFQKQLSRLSRQWTAAIQGFSPGDEKSALERLAQRREYRVPDVIDAFSTNTYGGDRSAPNGSSIAFVLEHGGKSCLFAADAHARVLCAALARLCKERDRRSIYFDAVKLPHHGSMGNITEELLDLIQSERWLISTNGAVFNHPDRATVELIAKMADKPPLILCNYQVASTDERLVPRNSERWTVQHPGVPPSPFVGPVGGLFVSLIAGREVKRQQPAASPPARRATAKAKRKA